jgi:hypothetical protein
VDTSWAAYLWATGMAPSFLNPGTPYKGAQLLEAVLRRWDLLLKLPRIQLEMGHSDATIRQAREYGPCKRISPGRKH